MAIKTQINQLRNDMTEMRGHLDDMLQKMDSFTGLASRTAEEADDLAKSLTRPSVGLPLLRWNPFAGIGNLLGLTALGLIGLAIFSPETLNSLWNQAQSYLGMAQSRVQSTMGQQMGGTNMPPRGPGQMRP